jgi:hypothetical protein
MPQYTVEMLYNISYSLMKYRGVYDPKMPSKKFFHFNNLLHKDSLNKELDPFEHKMVTILNKG